MEAGMAKTFAPSSQGEREYERERERKGSRVSEHLVCRGIAYLMGLC